MKSHIFKRNTRSRATTTLVALISNTTKKMAVGYSKIALELEILYISRYRQMIYI